MSSVIKYDMKSNENSITLVGNQKKKSPDRKPGLPPYCSKMFMSRPRQRGRIPHLFERSSKKWWNPQMDSEILEKQCLVFVLEQSRWYFQLALIFIMVACFSWIIYFGARQQPTAWVAGICWAAVLTVLCILACILTSKTNLYKKFSSYIAIAITAALIITVILAAYFSDVIMTSVGSFFLAAEAILLLYTVMPLPLHINFALGVAFSIAYEILYRAGESRRHDVNDLDIVAHVLLHICLHIIGVQICLNLQVRRRSTFWKVGQIINSNQSVEVEREFKKVMIDSIMPKSVMEKLMREGGNIFRVGAKEDGKFRPLYVERMEDVSILYADIVGFTKMSANKTADQLVQLLNDLFGRFDALCNQTGCEKISTLGDCYYCVAGCPDAKDDHARCCVEMGLGMIAAIRNFCADNRLNVDMRIGIHTGIVICGIVGMKRFKFDVWSNDVTFANQMEQWGVPGRIHISESTRECLAKLGDEYIIEEGKIEERAPKEIVEKGIRTFLIVKRSNEDSETSSMSGESSVSSQEVEDNNQNTPKVAIENELPRTKSNGFRTENTNDTKVQQAGGDAQPEEPRVGVALGDQGSERITANQRSSSHRHHHSSHYRRRDRQDVEVAEPTIKTDQIFELIGMHGIMPFLDSAVREKQDSEFVNTIKDDPKMKNINNDKSLDPISMMFKDEEIEKAYRKKYLSEVIHDEPITSFVSARFSFFLDLFIAFVVFMLVFFASLASLHPQVAQNSAWVVYFCIFFCLAVFVISVSGIYVFNIEKAPSWIKALILRFASCPARHLIGVVLLLCPAGMVFSHLWCHQYPPTCSKYLIIMGVVIIHFLNFNQLNSWIRSIIASIVAIIITCLVYSNPCTQPNVGLTSNTTTAVTGICTEIDDKYRYEFILDILLLMLFILIVNREYEVGHRLTFYSAHEAEENKNKMEIERNQIDQLLYHIIPPRVTEVIRDKKMYSQNHENVAVVFASITNFNEFYEEQFMGGKECIRILNELIGDVDELLDKEQYADVEKIKTIGSTFMIASGLNPTIERDLENHSHLATIMEFCMEMQDVIREFNENMVCFNFILRVGFNHGSVTAGVIGTTKLLYDIWGDTVNIASRMDSTGMKGRIHVSQESMNCLKDKFEFEHRGSTYVKGKGQMETYLLKRPGYEDKPQNNYPKVPYPEY